MWYSLNYRITLAMSITDSDSAKHYIYKLSININAKYVEQKGSMIMKSAVLRVVVNYEGTKFYTKDEKGYFKQHETLEDARMYLIYKYGADTVIKVETFVRFSY